MSWRFPTALVHLQEVVYKHLYPPKVADVDRVIAEQTSVKSMIYLILKVAKKYKVSFTHLFQDHALLPHLAQRVDVLFA